MSRSYHQLDLDERELIFRMRDARTPVRQITDRAHLAGLVGAGPIQDASSLPLRTSALLRPLAEYEAVAGGSW